jgi:ATP-dependent exoDNAse (exonuclease V) beta subunit
VEEKHRILCSNLGYFRKPGAGKAEQLLYIKETVDELNQLRKKLCIALSVLLGSSRLEAVLTFMQTFIASYQMQKRRSGVLTFADVASLAVDILTENKSLRRYYKESYKYIMIDEFQDNNEQQKELLYLLAERMDGEGDTVPLPSDLKADKLFFVGDEKQSIYRFRGSDVSVFKRLSSELAAIGGRHIQLDTNYRSEPALIQWFNTLFPAVMHNDGESFEADFSALGYRAASEGIQSRCTLLVKPYEAKTDEDDAADAEAEAFAIAALIDEMLHTDSYLIPSKEGPRRPESSDIALLLRTTGSQLSFEKALRRFSIPYTVQEARSLKLEAPANDMYAMLQLGLYPEDRHAYMTVLRSPFCNLSDLAMTLVLDTALFAAPDTIGSEDRDRMEALKAFYERLVKASATASLSSLVSLLWYESGYYLSLVSKPSYQVYVEHYTFLHRLAQMQQQQGKSLSQFVDFLRDNLAQNEKINDLDILKEQEQGVQILSIHKSKGLEFPIVVVANTGSKGKAEEDLISTYQGIPIPHYLSVPFSVSETQIEAARHAGQLLDKGTEAQLNRAELKRLLYVALTRAETHLVVSGCFSRNNRSLADDGRASTLLLMLCQALGIDIDDPACEQGIVTVKRIAPIAESFLYDQGGEDEGAFARRIETAGTWYAQQNEPYDLRPIRYAVTSLHEPIFSETAKALPVLPSDALLGEALAADFGTFVHALCEALVQHDKAVDPEELLPPSLSGSMHKQVIADAQMLCDAFFSSSWYKKEVEPYSVSSEVGFFSVVEHEGREVVAEGSIDLLVKRDDHYLVVDFKTDRFRDEEVHRFQVETYMQAMRRIHQCPVKGCVVYLRDVQDIVIWEEET